MNKIEEDKATSQSNLNNFGVPLKPDGTEYKIEEANAQQKHILLLVLDTLKTWVEHTMNPDRFQNSKFMPLRLTVRGMAGSGKSFLLHLLSSTIRKIFGVNSVDIKVAPTGTAAFNIEGQTCHSAFGLGVSKSQNKALSETKRQELILKFQNTLALFIDERSLLNSETLGGMEENASKTVHGGNHCKEDWGGIPVVIAIGDDRQLPTVRVHGKGRGAFQILEINKSNKISEREANGEQKFLDLAKNVVTLTTNQRVSEENKKFRAILERLREDKQTIQDAKVFESLDLSRISDERRKEIEKSAETLHLFAFNKDKDQLNIEKLAEISSEINPVAIIKSRTDSNFFYILENQKKEQNKKSSSASKSKQKTQQFKHFKDSNYPKTSTICVGCKVALKGRNFNPQWGLYNSSIGTVEEIVFEEGKNPNAGDLPLYVAVNFPSYTGPVWDLKNPTVVPIPIVKGFCDKGCCQIEYLPLELAFAKSIHTFQGMQAGPSNPIKRLIVHLGTIQFESNNPGLLYTAISRAMTIDENNNGNNSAIYFLNFEIQHFMNNAKKKLTNTLSKPMKAKETWIQHLDKNENKKNFTEDEITELLDWSQQKIPLAILRKCISNTSWRTEN